jgi:NifU-like protein involved in Fe-S cluster formation
LYRGVLPDADGYGRVTGASGDSMQLFLKIEKDRVKYASFLTDECGANRVCGSLAAELALGKTTNELTMHFKKKIMGRDEE